MSERERQTMSLNRQSILAVTGVGVGLLTLVYVLGVQVGKRSAALRGAQPGKAGEELGVFERETEAEVAGHARWLSRRT